MELEYIHDGAQQSPLLRFFNFTRPELSDLIAVFQTLARGSAPVELLPGPHIRSVNIQRFTLGRHARDLGLIPRGANSLEWLLTTESWQDVADRALSLRGSDLARTYQWLDESSSISVLLSSSGQW